MTSRRDLMLAGTALLLGSGCAGTRVLPAAGTVAGVVAAEWDIAAPERQGIDAAALAGVLRDGAQLPALRAMVVVRNGTLVGERYYNGASTDDLLPVNSVTKSVCAMLVGQALHQDRLAGLDATVGQLLPEAAAQVPGSAVAAVSLRQILTGRTGLASDWDRQSVALASAPDPLPLVMALPTDPAAAGAWRYNNAAVGLLSPILARAHGRDLAEVAARDLFGPLGSERYAWSRDRAGRPTAHAGLRLRPRDVARLAWTMADGGRWRGSQVVPSAWVAECMRPVSVAHAAAETAFKLVPGLGEERFPIFVGVPLISGGTAIGVLVLQRRANLTVTEDGAETDQFTQAEITLAIALGAPIMLAIERRLASALRSARLAGKGHVAGAVLGRAGVVPTTTALGAPPADLDRAFGRLREDLSRAMKKLATSDVPAVGAALDRFSLALLDARLRERVADAAKLPDGLRKVAKEYARAPIRLGTVAESAEYVADIEELCVLLADPRALRPGAVWIADRIHAFIAIAAVARGAAALVASDAVSLPAIAIARAAGLPVVSDVPGLFGWARPHDLLAVDGARGAVLVQPSTADIEAIRRAR